MSIIIGINAFHADSSAAIFKDGELLFAIEEEKLNRLKHWAGFPELSIKKCLEFTKIDNKMVNDSSDHFRLLDVKSVGDKVKVTIERDGKEKKIDVTLGALKE